MTSMIQQQNSDVGADTNRSNQMTSQFDKHNVSIVPAQQDALLAEAVKNHKRASSMMKVKRKTSTWFHKVFSNKQQQQAPASKDQQLYKNTQPRLSKRQQSLTSYTNNNQTTGRATAPSFQQEETHVAATNRNFADHHQQWHRAPVPQEVREDEEEEKEDGGSDIKEEEDDAFEDQWEVGSSDLEHGWPPHEEDENDDDYDDFLSEEDEEEEDAVQAISESGALNDERQDNAKSNGVQSTQQTRTRKDEPSKNPDSAEQVEEDVEVNELSPKETKKKKNKNKSKKEKKQRSRKQRSSHGTSDKLLEVSPEDNSNNNDDSFRLDEAPPNENRKNQKTATAKKSLDESTRDVTETTVDLEFSSGDWTTALEDSIPEDDQRALPSKHQKEKKNKKKSFKPIEEESPSSPEDQRDTHEEDQKKNSKRKSKKTKDKTQNEKTDLDQVNESIETDTPLDDKKSRRKSKKSGDDQGESHEMDHQKEEVANTDAKASKKTKRKSRKSVTASEDAEQILEATSEEPTTRKSKRKSRKSMIVVVEETEAAPHAEPIVEAPNEDEPTKKSKRKSRNSVVASDATKHAQTETGNKGAADEQPSDKSRRKSRKSLVAQEDPAKASTPNHEHPEKASEEPSKKSKRKSKKSVVLAETTDEAPLSANRERKQSTQKETAEKAVEGFVPDAGHAKTSEEELGEKAKKKNRTNSNEAAHRGITRLIGPTTIEVDQADDISILTDASYGEKAKPKDDVTQQEKSSKRKSSKRRNKRKSSRKSKSHKKEEESHEKSITLTTLLDDVVDTRTKLNDSLEASSGKPTMSQNLLKFMEKMLDSFAEVSDALELILTFGGCGGDAPEVGDAHDAWKCITENYVTLLDYLWRAHLQSAVERHFFKESEDDELKDLLYRVAVMLSALTAQFRDQFIERGEFVGDIERNRETKRLFVTLFELLRHEAFAIGSYKNEEAPTFQPSAMLQEAWGVTSNSQIWHEVYRKAESPREFRRTCIRFVVNESEQLTICVKSMEMLLDYCELEFADVLDESSHRQVAQAQSSSNDEGEGNKSAAAVPKAAKIVLKSIRGAPLTREQIVDRVLNRVLPPEKPDTHTNTTSASITVLQGRPCVGKTTLTALIAQDSSVREYFDSIIWIRLGRTKRLDYARYNHHLRAIANLSAPVDLKLQSLLHLPGESDAQHRERERKAMQHAKAKMTTYLKDKRVLVILDHLSSQDELEWFDFSQEGQDRKATVLATTRVRGIGQDPNVLTITKLGEEKEATWLLHRECNTTTRALSGKAFEMPVRSFFESDLVRAMVRLCSLHPMAVATLGRFISLQCQQNSLNGQEGLVSVGYLFTDFKSNGGIAALLEVLSMSLSPTVCGVPSRAIRLCLVAFVTVFCTERQLRDHLDDIPFPRVSAEIAELLFESVLVLDDEVLREETVFYQHKEKAAELIQKVLSILGVLSDPTNSLTQSTYLTHQVYGEFVQDLINNDEDLAQFAICGGKGWHRAMVSNLLDSSEDWDESDTRQQYAISAIPFHMIAAEMFVEAGDMLSKRKFVKRRIAALGLPAAVRKHIKDMGFLLEGLVPGPIDGRIDSRSCYVPIIRQAYQALVDTITKLDADQYFEEGEVSQALVDIGSSFSEWHCYEDAIACWMTSLLMSSMSVAERSEVLFALGAAYEQLQEYEKAITFLKQCLELRRISRGDDHVSCAMTLQKIADLLLMTATDSSEVIGAYTEALDVFKSNNDVADIQHSLGYVHEMLGRIYYKKGEQVTSLDHYMSALQSTKQHFGKKSPTLVSLYNQVGMCVLDLNKKEDAKDAFAKALKLVETEDEEIDLYNPDFLIPKGMLTGMEGKKRVSRRCFRRALEVLEGDHESLENEWKLAFVRYTLTMFEE